MIYQVELPRSSASAKYSVLSPEAYGVSSSHGTGLLVQVKHVVSNRAQVFEMQCMVSLGSAVLVVSILILGRNEANGSAPERGICLFLTVV